MSEVKVNKISPRSGTDVTLGDASDTFTIPASATLDVNGTIDVTGATVTGLSLASVEDDIALLGFKVAANGSLAKYNLVDQTIDDFQDTSGVDASASTNEVRNDSKYYSGGVITRTSFTSTGSDTYTTPAALVGKVEVLVVAGGGAGMGGGHGGGAGGAGGLVYVNEYTAAASTTYNLTIGAGGVGRAAANYGYNGGDSVFDTSGTATTLTASGGGGAPEATTAAPGGSGGGGYSTGGALAGGASDQVATFGSYSNVGFGSAGGNAFTSGTGGGGGGGGGAGAVGNQGVPQGTGDGGIGKAYTIADGTTSVYYAGGGGGGVNTGTTTGAGGTGGGGKGGFGTHPSYTEPVAGTANTGGGGGGGRNDGGGASGGSGIIIVVHKIPGDLTLVSNATTAEAVPTKADLVMTYTNGVGTATIGTDLIAYVSRDGGTTYTSFGLSASSDQGDSGGHTVLTAHDLDISSQPSGSSMRYKITTHNQSVSKETRIQAVSLGWS